MNKTFSLVLPAIGAALLAVLSQLSFSIGPVPITLQTFAVGLLATVFKSREAVLSVALYLLLGALGLPVFAGGSGGFQALLGPNAGYLWAYLLFALVTSSLTHKDRPFYVTFAANLLGDALVFVGGVLGLHLLGGFEWSYAFAVGVTPFILPDLLKIAAITLISIPLFKSLSFHPYFSRK
ncbi:Substrate-specific component BioY of biotin ECF transporter [Streptococcus sp. DD11]|uniref:biotin transporter BioY n=1 Tax=Streptococcus sp. DD11 TaxID=1777879 RepID=UPI0007930368|nr:biotin transporter BioY [Streptococcus sp. DD11]KXT84380.1 Substrate-specific component BioY of biotin ECF transporter [Streptococcus sp. DD11]